jgi:thiosulfate/3-mercaptopyruvate sulfurtransferase|tara:strand:- start:1259 stop:2134 length:876 start_codon:yes stop_codon:yes gene_type:complete
MKWKYPESVSECEWLVNNLDRDDIRIYDCTTYLHYADENPLKPYDVESGLKDYKVDHIPGAIFLDIQSQLSKKNSPYRFTLPKLDKLVDKFQEVGVGNPYHIILYSRNGMQWSARVWWMLRSVGFDNVSILNGGFIEWLRLGLATESKINIVNPANFIFKPRPHIFVQKEKVIKSMNNKNVVLLNSLTEDIYSGKNPRYGRRGRIPNSINIPFNYLLDQVTGKFKPLEEIKLIFERKEIKKDQLILNYCGGGIAASLNGFALLQLGFEDLQIYDNSMSEWAMDKTLPIETD